MSEKSNQHGFSFCNNLLTVNGVVKVLEISEKEAQFKLEGSVMTVKGGGLNVVKLDRDSGVVQLETQSLQSVSYRGSVGVKGLFR